MSKLQRLNGRTARLLVNRLKIGANLLYLRYNLGYTFAMKTAISIPNPLFERSERIAKHLGISRSELYTRALTNFIRLYSREEITQRLNEIYAVEDSSPDDVLSRLQWMSLPKENW